MVAPYLEHTGGWYNELASGGNIWRWQGTVTAHIENEDDYVGQIHVYLFPEIPVGSGQFEILSVSSGASALSGIEPGDVNGAPADQPWPDDTIFLGSMTDTSTITYMITDATPVDTTLSFTVAGQYHYIGMSSLYTPLLGVDSYTITLPAGTQAGDELFLLLFGHDYQGGIDPITVSGTGWSGSLDSLIANDTTGSSPQRQAVKVVTADGSTGDPTVVLPTGMVYPGAGDMGAVIYVVGLRTGTQIDSDRITIDEVSGLEDGVPLFGSGPILELSFTSSNTAGTVGTGLGDADTLLQTGISGFFYGAQDLRTSYFLDAITLPTPVIDVDVLGGTIQSGWTYTIDDNVDPVTLTDNMGGWKVQYIEV